jgi:hypothetical protein
MPRGSWRDDPTQRTDELVTKNVIPQMTYDKIKDQIITRPKEGNRQKIRTR